MCVRLAEQNLTGIEFCRTGGGGEEGGGGVGGGMERL